MGWFDNFQDSHNEVHNNGNLTHDLLAGAVSYEIAKGWEDHCAKNGRPDNHAKAKEVIAGLAGAAVMRLGETKGRDLWDNYQQKKVQQQAVDQVQETIITKSYST